jgi:hypothetical protein
VNEGDAVTEPFEQFQALATAEREAYDRMCELIPEDLRPTGGSSAGKSIFDQLGVVSTAAASNWDESVARLDPKQRAAAEAYDQARLRAAMALLFLD